MHPATSPQDGIQIAPDALVESCILSHVRIGRGARIFQSEICGTPDSPVIIGDHVHLSQCIVQSTGKPHRFAWGAWSLETQGTHIGQESRFSQSSLRDAQIGQRCQGQRCAIQQSRLEDDVQLRAHANLTASHLGHKTQIGSEVSKSLLLGAGFVSEHTASYLSLVAPAHYPLLDPNGREILRDGLPNLTNIGAGTVFANYSGKPLPAPDLDESTGSQKGTALVYGAFTAVNSVIVNRYGQPTPEEDPFALLRRRDITALGFGCFVERKVAGRIPAFSYAASTHARDIRIGWVLEKQPGIILNLIKKMQKVLGNQAPRLEGFVEGTLRLEIKLLEEARNAADDRGFQKEQIDNGLQTLHRHLDGRWKIDESGRLVTPWRFDEAAHRWCPSL